METTLNDVFDNWLEKGIFYYLNNFGVPWKTDIEPQPLDIVYHGRNSGEKTISPVIEKMMVDGDLPPERRTLIAKTLFNLYGVNWQKLYRTLSLEYEPIENYNMIEKEDGTNATKTTTTQTSTNKGKGTLSGTQGINGESTDSSNNNDYVFGFNSEDKVNSNAGNITSKNTNKSDMKTDQSTTSENTVTGNNTNDEKVTTDRTLTRHGNIGVTTSQQMLESEIHLWQWHFFDEVFKNIDDVLTLRIYE